MLVQALALILGRADFRKAYLANKYQRDSSSIRLPSHVSERHHEAFPSFFAEHVQPLVQDFETLRLQQLAVYQKRLRGLLLFFICSLLLLLWLWHSVWQHFFQFALFFAFAANAIFYSWSKKPIAEFRGGIKLAIFPKLLAYFGEDFRYSAIPTWSLNQLTGFGILPDFDRQQTEDQLDGYYQHVHFRMMEAHLLESSEDSEGRQRERTVFNGFLMLFNFNKSFAGRTVIQKDQGVLSKWFKGSSDGLERVRLEDPQFESLFDVFSTDQIEARYLLTPSFMERLLSLSKVFGGKRAAKSICCSFFNHQLLLMVDNASDRFATSSIFEQITFEHETATLFNELNEVFAVIDTLQLHNKTGV